MAPSYNSESKASELVAHYASEIAGKIILITGASAGSLGESFVKQIAIGKPAILILAGRSVSKMQGLIDELNATHPTVNVKPLPLNLLSFTDVRKAADTLKSWADVPQIDILINNAGIMAVRYRLTEDGCETQFQTNHLGSGRSDPCFCCVR
ncbi:hypothetical protein N8I77_008429 [Diaporthe amygdali]|uniref:Uncharacterized protein n=1 Tax=Phomopsis amygdali TaxID=1214568 RepID=A0AAD9W2D7_PHOAM|nr:hypothetical protein N8I77_008429 [Diaporthe amygdali]